MGTNALSKKATGNIITLLSNEALVICHNTGSSLLFKKSDDFSAFTAKSSPRIPAVFSVATLLMVATSSISTEISSNKAKKEDAIYFG